ncbi:PTS sugar transporter subunit IIB [Spiroplasma poulsonii]|uniref:PTS sugar transporter subunit IIB n=1 Tax=Spiroplasma poulsonii TaxID=2138 RepID=UPI001F54776C|nr:hypothetical protein [Spiroplasma poulsonii]
MEDAAEGMDIDVHVEAKAMAEAQSVLDDYDVILLGPQVKYIENNIKSMTKNPFQLLILRFML